MIQAHIYVYALITIKCEFAAIVVLTGEENCRKRQ